MSKWGIMYFVGGIIEYGLSIIIWTVEKLSTFIFPLYFYSILSFFISLPFSSSLLLLFIHLRHSSSYSYKSVQILFLFHNPLHTSLLFNYSFIFPALLNLWAGEVFLSIHKFNYHFKKYSKLVKNNSYSFILFDSLNFTIQQAQLHFFIFNYFTFQ